MAEVPTTQRTVLAHALNLEEDWRLNNAADEQSVSALCGVPRGVALVGDEIHKEGPYAIQRKDDLDTCVVSGPLPDILRCLSTSSLRAPAHDQQHIPATSKLQPIIDGERDVSLEIAPQGLDGHPSTRWGPSFAVLNIMDRGYLYCFPVRRRESEKLDMGIYLLVLWTLLRGSPPKAPVEVIKEALHNPGSSVPIGQSYDVLFAQIQEEPAAVPLQVFSSKEKNALNPKKAYSALTATALDQLANVLGDADLVSSLLDRLLGPVWREEQLYLPDFITKGVHGYVEVFFKRTQVAGVNCVDLNTRLVELSRTLPEILQTVFRPYAPFTYNMSVAVWGGCDFSMCDLETGASARQYIPHSIDTAEESAQHLHHLQGSALSITLKPAFVKTLHSALMSPGSPISVYDHLGCGELGQNIRVRALRRSQLSQQQIQQLMRMNCEKLATGLSIDEAMSLNFYNGWPAHGPNSTQILETNVISSLQEHLQIYIRDGRKEATLLKVKEKVLKIIQDFVIVEDSASPDGNALRLETGTVLNFQGGRDANQHLYGVIEGLLKEGIKRHQSFDAYAHCVSYSAEAASAIRRQFLREWGDVLFEVLQTGLEIDATVLDKYVTAVGILSYMYNPVADPRQNPVGRAALNAMPNFNLRAHARHFGLPAMDRSLVEALLTESVLLDVDSTIIERVANFTSGVRSGRGGSGSTYNAITMGVMRRCLAPRVGNYPLPSTKESIKRLLGPLIRNFLPYRVLQNVPLGKAMVFDKEFLNPENTRFRAKAVELHISNHRLTPFEKFQRLEEGNVFPEPMRLGPAIPLFGDFTSLFTNEGTSDHVLAVLRGIVEKIEAMDTDHPPGCRHQPYEPALGPGNCIATTFTENLQAVSCEEVAVLILTLIKQLSEVPNLAVEGLRQLVDNYERWFIANGSSQEAAWDTIINHVAYSLQYPPRFRWYFHVTGLVQARHVSFYRLQGPEGGLDRDVPAEERVASGQNDSDDFEISPLPGVVDVATLQACDKAGNELDVILNAYMLNPNSKRMEVKLRNVVRQ